VKNYVQIFFWYTGFDPPGPSPNYATFGFSPDYATANSFASNPDPGNAAGAVKVYYLMLNKWNAMTLLGKYSDIEIAGLLSTDPKLANSFNVEASNFASLPDKNSVRARRVAEEVLKVESGVGPKGQLQLSVLTSLWLTYSSLINYTGNQQVVTQARSVAHSVLLVINALSAGTITEAEALTRYQKIVDANPFFFKL